MATGGSSETELKRLQEENVQLRIAVALLEGEVAQLKAVIQTLRQQLADLQEKLNQNSRNSSRPPSADLPGAVPKRHCKKSKRHRGAQPGHENHQWQPYPPDRVDKVIPCKPKRCQHCHAPLAGEDPQPRREQRVDLPPIQPEVTEYQVHTLLCPCCGRATTGRLPAAITPTIFGPRIQALVALLTGAFRLAKREVVRLLQEAFQVELSLGMVARLEQATSQALAQPFAQARSYVQEQPVTYLDETGWRESKHRAWLWTLASKFVLVYLIRRSRGAAVAQELLGAAYPGVSHSDRWSAYQALPLGRRQVCWAHLGRDFQKVAERRGRPGWLGRRLRQLATKMLFEWGRVRDGTLGWRSFKLYLGGIKRRIRTLLEMGANCRHHPTATFCANLRALWPALWTFSRVAGVEPTNNFAERALRKPVLWRKGSFGTDSPRGSRFVERILTTVMSLRAQKRNLLDYLVQVCQAARLGQPAPSLLPLAENTP